MGRVHRQSRLTRRRHRPPGGLQGPALQAGDDGAGQASPRLHARGRPEPEEWIGRDRVPRPRPARTATTSGRSSSCCRTRWASRCWWCAGASCARGERRAPRRRPRPPCKARSTGKARPSCRSAATSAKACPASPTLYLGPGHRHRGRAARQRAAGCLVGRRRRRLRHAAGKEPGMRARGALSHRRAKGATGSGRSGRPTTRCPTTARSATCCARMGRHPNRPGHIHMMLSRRGHVPRDHAPLRRRQPVPRLRCGVRRARQPGRRVRAASAGQGARRPRDGQAVLRRPTTTSAWCRNATEERHEDRQGHRAAYGDLHLQRAHHRRPRRATSAAT